MHIPGLEVYRRFVHFIGVRDGTSGQTQKRARD